MQVIDYNTRLFKNIFSSYEEFKKWYKSTPLSSSDSDVPSERTFSLIAYEYNDCHTAMSAEGFKEHFAIDLYTYYKEFEETTKAIDELMELSDDDVAENGVNIVNVANIPETENSTDIETVDYVSNQQKSILKKGKMQVKREQIGNKRAYTVHTFLRKFLHLFIRVVSPSYTFVVYEEDDE